MSTTSRYYTGYVKGALTHRKIDGTEVRYLRRRFIPPPEKIASIGHHKVTEGDRPDTLAASTLGDSEQSWRLYDANGCMHPDDLTDQNGKTITIPMPGTYSPAT
ncbi:MAG: LysM domain-containing protein [Gammaproteobacteria bacterium]|nr:LysM domain-containing protein [Gammaproteobacteria bacterium]